MRKFISLISILLIILALPVQSFAKEASSGKAVELEYKTSDNYIVNSFLSFPDYKASKYPLVVLLHSWGGTSAGWNGLEKVLNKAGFAVLKIDLRGHGKSRFLSNLKQRSWMFLDKETIAKYPEDVYNILYKVQNLYKNISMKEIAFIGADIGGSTAIYTAYRMSVKPFAMVLISPQTNFKGMYLPIKFAEGGNYPNLVIVSKSDNTTLKQVSILKKYAQGSYNVLMYDQGGTGMHLVKANPKSQITISNWLIDEYRNNQKERH